MKNQGKKLVLTIGLSLGAVACVGGGDTAASLTEWDFNIRPTVLSDSIARDRIVESYAFYNDWSNKNPSELFDCYREKYTDYPFMADVDGYFVLDAPLVDVSDCISMDDRLTGPLNDEVPGLIMGERIISYYYRVKAVNSTGNIVDLNGVNAFDLDSVLENVQSKEVLFKAITSYTYLFDNFNFGQIEAIYKEKTFKSSKSDSGAGCVEELGIIDECIERSLVVGDLSLVEGEAGVQLAELSIFESHNLQTSNLGTFYTGGSINFTINNWEGVVEYDEHDTEILPSCSATNGSETISGELPFNKDRPPGMTI